MGRFDDSTTFLAVCDRCKTRLPGKELMPDGNSPGLRVCVDCRDVLDPWRLAARKTEDISLQFPRPDVKIPVVQGAGIELEGLPYVLSLITENGLYRIVAE